MKDPNEQETASRRTYGLQRKIVFQFFSLPLTVLEMWQTPNNELNIRHQLIKLYNYHVYDTNIIVGAKIFY